jgi:uncharacterized protein with von Willebrand factor type A (vWA) domain
MKIVINKCYGGYGLSKEAYKELGIKWDNYGYEYEDDRSNPDLIKVVEKLGRKANGALAELQIVEIPDNVEYEINEYDGIESVHEVHRSWY